MNKEELEVIKKYLIWRFNTNNINKYKKYCAEWVEKLTINQINYFKEEMNRLINRGEYQK